MSVPRPGTWCRDFRDRTHGAHARVSGIAVPSAPPKKPDRGKTCQKAATRPSGPSQHVGTGAVPHGARAQPATVITPTAGHKVLLLHVVRQGNLHHGFSSGARMRAQDVLTDKAVASMLQKDNLHSPPSNSASVQ